MNTIELLIWDMDGTLIHSASVVPDSYIATASEVGNSHARMRRS